MYSVRDVWGYLGNKYWLAKARLRPLSPTYTPWNRVRIAGVEFELRGESVAERQHLKLIRTEKPLLNRFESSVDADDTVWDIGANVGIYTLVSAHRGAETISFEPFPPNQEAIAANLERNDLQAEIRPEALGDESGTREFFTDPRNTAGGGHGSLITDQGGDSISVPVARGDDLADLPRPTVVKVDVEGAEADCLNGFRKTLTESVRTIFVECHTEQLHEEVASILTECGFSITNNPEKSDVPILIAKKD